MGEAASQSRGLRGGIAARGLSVVGAVLQSLGGISVAVLRLFGRIDVFPGANGFAVGGLRGGIAAVGSLSALSRSFFRSLRR